MKMAVVALLLLLCCGCEQHRESTAAMLINAPATDKLVNRVWIRSDGEDDLPGRKLIFLSNGTLVQDSCWEPYRLSAWRRELPNRLQWTEDSAVVQADVQSLTENELVLRLVVPNETQDQHFRVTVGPYVCPDMKR